MTDKPTPTDAEIDAIADQHKASGYGTVWPHAFARAILAKWGAQPSITLDFKMATELLKMFGEEPGLVTLQHGSERSHSGTGLYALYSHLPEEGAEFLGAEPDNKAMPEAAAGVTAAPVDAERLDYLQECGVTVEVLPGRPGWTFRIGGLHGTVHRSVRTAIDAARAAQEGKHD